MIIEPSLKLALALEANPGVYALLIGSGVSRAAGIPTGWEIVIDLIRKLATINSEEIKPDPVSWYRARFDKDPKYDDLINIFAATQTERRNILRPYFEPTQEESEQDLKIPTIAHHAIAALARMGYIRMILTTNFDRLLEIALEKEGIVPDVISSDDQLHGAIPYIHSKCYLIKIHGDYLDTRIKNTSDELATYSREMNEQIDRILDEFGLIVCGWSGAYDTALRNAIMRCPNRRFTTFWLYKGEINEDAKDVIRSRKAETIAIDNADQAFGEILERVESLSELTQVHPMSTAMSVSTVKRYIVDPKQKIRLHDLVHKEIERVYQELNTEKFNTDGVSLSNDFFQERMRQYESLVERLMSMLAALSFFDLGENAYLITNCLERLTHKPSQSGYIYLLNLQFYPALLVCYTTGLCALANNRFSNLAAILLKPKYREYYYSDVVPAIEKLNPNAVFASQAEKMVARPNAEREYTPANNYLLDILKPVMRNYLPDEIKYEETFDIFEYLLGLVYMDVLKTSSAPIGRFGWTHRWSSRKPPPDVLIATGTELGSEWGLLKAGFFNGSMDRLNKLIQENDVFLKEETRGWH